MQSDGEWRKRAIRGASVRVHSVKQSDNAVWEHDGGRHVVLRSGMKFEQVLVGISMLEAVCAWSCNI